MIDQGYQKIGLISGPPHWWVSNERRLGWEKALTNQDLTSHPRQIVHGDWSAKSGEIALAQLFQQFPEMDAVFVCNDQMALGALSAAQKLNKLVPKDLAIAGFDGIPESAYFSPPLTTVRYDLAGLGAKAVEELDHLIKEKQDGEKKNSLFNLYFPPELVIRESTKKKGT
jgi:DNA-binding LacI/PurR family transcriptional regulator